MTYDSPVAGIPYAAWVLERYIGHEPDLKARLQSILQNASEVKQNIQSVGQQMTPAEAVPTSVQPPEHPLLRGRRFLVVDADESVRRRHNMYGMQEGGVCKPSSSSSDYQRRP